MNLKDYNKEDWVNVSKGNWSFLSCTDFINQYSRELLVCGENPFDHPIQVCSHNISELWFLQSEIDQLGTRLVKTFNSQEKVQDLCDNAKRTADEVRAFINNCAVASFDARQYRELWEKIKTYYTHHLAMKYIGDYLSPDDQAAYLPSIQEARVYAESVFDETERLTRQLIARITHETGVEEWLVAYLTREELSAYLDKQTMPLCTDLENRNKKAILWADETTYGYVTGKDAETLEVFLNAGISEDIKGVSAFPGVVQGRVKIVLDPFQTEGFGDGDVLVAGMTRPDYAPLFKRAGAVVTDAGGILSHAAIAAREMKKPCIIGTKNATKVLKDGDLVEVDADRGMVKILK
jgi:phosphohistidine swiveling domain-containing protein